MIDLTTPSARRTELFSAAAFFAVILIFTVWYMATHQAPAPYQAEVADVADTPESLPPTVYEEHGQYFDIEASYPAQTLLKGSLGDDADENALAIMEEFVMDTVDEFKSQGNFENLTPEDVQIMGLSDTRKESILISFEEKQGPKTVSYVFTLFVDTLGAHPNMFYRTFMFDRTTGDELSIGDLFVSGSDYLKRLSAISEFELAKTLKDSADVEYIREGVTPELVNFQSFAIEGGALLLVFPPYQVAPYSAGPQEVSIPLSQLSEILKPAYQP